MIRPLAPVICGAALLAPAAARAQTWTPVPASTIANGTGTVVSGRVNAAVSVPGGADTMYVGVGGSRPPSLFLGLPGDHYLPGVPGMGGGGVWKTTNWISGSGNPSWTPLTDAMPSLAVGMHGLAMSAQDHDILYAAADGPQGAVLKTSDGGATWAVLGDPLFANVQFGGIVVSPGDSNTVYAAVFRGDTGGVFKSTDGGATWNVTASSLPSGYVSHIAMDPVNPAILYAGYVDPGNPDAIGVWKTTDGGDSWTRTGAFPGFTPSLYIEIAIAPSAPDVVYAVAFDDSTIHRSPSIFRSPNGGASWTRACRTAATPDGRYWHQVLAVDPADSNVVYATGFNHVGVISRTGGGSSANCAPSPWAQWWTGDDPDGVVPYQNGGAWELAAFGDRGIYRVANPLSAPDRFIHQQGNLSNLLLSAAVPSVQADTVYGVAFDQGSGFLAAGGAAKWSRTHAGRENIGQEIGTFWISAVDPAVMCNVTAVGIVPSITHANFLNCSTDGGSTWSAAAGFQAGDFSRYRIIQADPAAWTALTGSPFSADTVYFGAQSVFVSGDRGSTWSSYSTALASESAFISALAASPAQPGMLYAANSSGQLWMRSGGSWSRVPGTSVPAGGFISVIAASPDSADNLYIAVQGPTGAGRIQTRHGDGSWTDVTGNLPARLAVYTLAVDWLGTGVVYAGTDRGVYAYDAAGGTWTRFGTGLPSTLVSTLAITSNGVMTAATYGRGAYQVRLSPSARRRDAIRPAGRPLRPPLRVRKDGSTSSPRP